MFFNKQIGKPKHLWWMNCGDVLFSCLRSAFPSLMRFDHISWSVRVVLVLVPLSHVEKSNHLECKTRCLTTLWTFPPKKYGLFAWWNQWMASHGIRAPIWRVAAAPWHSPRAPPWAASRVVWRSSRPASMNIFQHMWFIGQSLEYHGNIFGISWEYHGNIFGISSEYHGNIMVFLDFLRPKKLGGDVKPS